MDFGARHYDDPARARIATIIVAKLQEVTGSSFAGARPSDRFIDDLQIDELDSLASVEILVQVETELGITISDEEASATHTIDDLVNLAASKTQAV